MEDQSPMSTQPDVAAKLTIGIDVYVRLPLTEIAQHLDADQIHALLAGVAEVVAAVKDES